MLVVIIYYKWYLAFHTHRWVLLTVVQGWGYFSQEVYMAPYESYFPYFGEPSKGTPLDSSALELGCKWQYVGWNILGDASILDFGSQKYSILTLIGGKNSWQVILKFWGHCDCWCWFDEELGILMTLEIFELSSSTYGITSMLEYGATNIFWRCTWMHDQLLAFQLHMMLSSCLSCSLVDWNPTHFGKVLHHPLEGNFKQWSLSNLWSMIDSSSSFKSEVAKFSILVLVYWSLQGGLRHCNNAMNMLQMISYNQKPYLKGYLYLWDFLRLV